MRVDVEVHAVLLLASSLKIVGEPGQEQRQRTVVSEYSILCVQTLHTVL